MLSYVPPLDEHEGRGPAIRKAREAGLVTPITRRTPVEPLLGETEWMQLQSLVRHRIVVWLIGSTVGGAVLALPDNDARVFSFSDTHGPSVLDLAGIAVLVSAWLPILALLRRSWRLLGDRRRPVIALAALGALVLVVTVVGDLGPTWLAGVSLLVAAQLYALWTILSRSPAE